MLLRDKDRVRLLEIFNKVELPFEVWAYGSRVNGKAHEGSDLDLVIRTQNLQELPFDILSSLKENIRESNIPIVVELFDWARLPESFHRNIEAEHEVLFSNFEVGVNEPSAQYKKGQNNK
ncbi:MAG: nucleotidyltransferase domain-containing protein [Chitinophagales bacterium]